MANLPGMLEVCGKTIVEGIIIFCCACTIRLKIEPITLSSTNNELSNDSISHKSVSDWPASPKEDKHHETDVDFNLVTWAG